jgi:hypothetical protein
MTAIENLGDVIEYTTACRMASVFEKNTRLIEQKLTDVQELIQEIADAFNQAEHYNYHLEYEYHSRRVTPAELVKHLKLTAWNTIISHTGIRKVMSSKRQEELNKILHSQTASDADKLPDISEDSIVSVINGYASSAEDLLFESIREEYDYWKPGTYCKLKTNLKSVEENRLGKKIIATYATDGRQWLNHSRGYAGYSISFRARPHFMNIDNIMHLLDGKGTIKGNNGPLVDAISLHVNGETEYFKFKCFENRNVHLEFKRTDLLDKFNAICGRNRLGGSQ